MSTKLSAKQLKSREAINYALNEHLYGHGIALSQRHLRQYPDDGIVWLDYAHMLYPCSRYDETENALQKALEYLGESAQDTIYATRGRMYQRQGLYAQAEDMYHRAAELDPEFAPYHVYLGTLVLRGGDIARAESIYRSFLARCGETAKDHDELMANLAGVLVVQGRYEEAKEYYLRAIELDPNYKWAKHRLRDVRKVLAMRPKAREKSAY